jgi:hypothetical protein
MKMFNQIFKKSINEIYKITMARGCFKLKLIINYIIAIYLFCKHKKVFIY